MPLTCHNSAENTLGSASSEPPSNLRDELQSILDKLAMNCDCSLDGMQGHCTVSPPAVSTVIFGAGQLGTTILRVLRRSGIEPVAFTDNNPDLWTKPLEGVEVLSPVEAARRHGTNAIFVIAIWHPSEISIITNVSNQLAELGCRFISTFPVVLWTLGQESLPYYLWDLPNKLLLYAEQIKAAFELLADNISQAEFVNQVRLRAFADFASLSAPCTDPQYFPRDILEIAPTECFVDCGAYTGDSIAEFLAHSKAQFRRVIAFEPDPDNLAALRKYIGGDPTLLDRVSVCGSAVGADTGVITFNGNGLPSASSSPMGAIEVQRVALDSVLRDEWPTFIKMDIEGAELDALEGARESIQKYRPRLAICVYHRPDHLWRIPLAIRDLLPDSRIYFRAHRADGFDLVCYAVPTEVR